MAKFTHAQQRAVERIGVQLTHHDLDLMVLEIEEGRSRFQRAALGGRQLHLVNCPAARRHLIVIYDPQARDPIITILPDEHFEEQARRKSEGKLKKRTFKREIDVDWLDDPVTLVSVELPKPAPAANDAMAEALRKAFQEAGMSIPGSPISA